MDLQYPYCHKKLYHEGYFWLVRNQFMMSKMYTILLICYTFMTAFVTEKSLNVSLTMQQAPSIV